ncbi:MAG: tagatose 1,6-diphosphate aldolase [Chloroflexi bacterium]|nr:tagatose 1,6-diphosphate aldolase [Chloroflexota bacterium]MCL5274764.1 tagatose 1,6-diphosphate aldolase [Chloroflexota bacterium]
MLTLGTWRGLQAASTPRGAFVILALDHRNNLRAMLRPDAPETVTSDELVAFKRQVVAALAPLTSAVLLDPVYGVAQSVVSSALPGQTGLIITLDETGYKGSSTARISEILDGWSVEKIKRAGGDGVKLLVYYHPDAATARTQEDLIRRVAGECARHDIALYLELLSFSLDPARRKLQADEREQVVIESARRLSNTGITILKAEFPVDYAVAPDEQKWLDACRRLSKASAVPWVLLSAAAPYDIFKRQVEVAAIAGASGVMVGRAAWQEAGALSGQARIDFLRGEGRRRMQELGDILELHARPWNAVLADQVPVVSDQWYRQY